MAKDFTPEFSLKMEGRCYARYLGPKDPDSIRELYDFLRREKWRGQLQINMVGNGGVNDIVFDEVRKITDSGEKGLKIEK